MRKIVLAAVALVLSSSLALGQDEEGGGGGRRGQPAGPANPFTGNLPAIAQGQSLYDTNCTACHGTFGEGSDLGTSLASSYRNDLNDSDSAIFKRIKMGAAGTVMPAFNAKLTDDDIWKVTAFIKSLRGMAVNAPVNGNVQHGHEVFYGKGQCANCHTIAGQGGIGGPELSNIADIRKISAIVGALTKPMHHVYRSGGAHQGTLDAMGSYLQIKVVQKNGKVVNGTLLNESLDSLQILGDDKQLHLLDRATVRSATIQDKSAMPTDYDKRLTPVEFTDLLAYLTRQSTKPPARPAAAAAR